MFQVRNCFANSLLAAALTSVALFSVQPAIAASETVLHSFSSGADGFNPYAGLINVGGTLYGTTFEGGANGTNGNGSVFKVNPSTGAETLIYSFNNTTDGFSPFAGLINVGGILYGTTQSGGYGGGGTVFSVNPTTGSETVVYSFCSVGNRSCPDGETPLAGLINVSGTLYGTTTQGGSADRGAVFSINPATGAETVVYSFQGGRDGYYPFAGLIAYKGDLYGMTVFGGGGTACEATTGCGTVFKVNPTTGAEAVLHSFGSGTDGINPGAGLINVSGTLYGTTTRGGAAKGGTGCYDGCGTVFSINPSTGAETVVYSFRGGTDGNSPIAGLIAYKGDLYGTTTNGGEDQAGMVFKINLSTGTETVLHSFQFGWVDGSWPFGRLINVGGAFYGTTFSGGTNSVGTVFKITSP